MISTRVAISVLCCLFATIAIADESETKQSLGSSPPLKARETDLRVLLREVGARMHKHFVADPRDPAAIDMGGLEHQEITYPQLLSILALNGMVVIADDGIMQVTPNTDARQAALPVLSPDNVKTLDNEWVTCVIPIKNITAAQLVPILRPLIPQYGHLAAMPDRNALIMVDRAANVRRIVEVIKILENLPKAADVQTPKAS